MSNRTFCILLAAFLMLLGAGTKVIMRIGIHDEEEAVQTASAASVEEKLISPTGTWQVSGEFGALYSEEYGQWMLRDDVLMNLGGETEIIAPMSGSIVSIQAEESGGSCIQLDHKGIVLTISPVYSLQIFEGSKVNQGDMLGIGREYLVLRAEQEEMIMDPLELASGSRKPDG